MDAISSFFLTNIASLPGQTISFLTQVASSLPFVGKLFFYATAGWGLFLMYCTLKLSMANGKLAATPIYVKLMSYALLAFMATADVLFNFTVASLIFMELPKFRTYNVMHVNIPGPETFSDRCADHLGERTWRGAIASWVCNGWLIPFDAGHCNKPK